MIVGGFSVEFSNKILKHLFRGTADLPSFNTLYVGLYITSPNAMTVGQEVTGGSYARAAAIYTDPVDRLVTNLGDVVFGIPSGPWGTPRFFAVHPAATGASFIGWGTLNTPITIGAGQVVRFPVGRLTIRHE